MMTEKANELGLKEFKFINSSGLNNSDLLRHIDEGQQLVGDDTEENVMSARATAKLAYHLLKDFPEVLETTSIPVIRRSGKERMTVSKWKIGTGCSLNLLRKMVLLLYEGVDGLKNRYN